MNPIDPSILQWGFGAFALILLTMLGWLMRWVCTTLKGSIDENTKAIAALQTTLTTLCGRLESFEREGEARTQLLVQIKDNLLSRPCLVKKQ